MLFPAMREGDDFRTPEEQLEQLDVLRHLDARDVAGEALHAGNEAAPAEDDSAQPAQRRRLWLGLRLALIVTIGIVLIVAALFRFVLPPQVIDTTQPSAPPAEQVTTPPAVPETSAPAEPERPLAEQVQAQVSQSYRWQYATGMQHLSAPVFDADGRLYVLGHPPHDWTYRLFVFAPDGELDWTYQAEGLSHNQALFFSRAGLLLMAGLSPGGAIRALDARGREVWSRQLEGEPRGAALSPDRRTLYVAHYVSGRTAEAGDASKYGYVNECRILALDEHGQVRWEYGVGGDLEEGPMLGSGGQPTPGLCVDDAGGIYFCTTTHRYDDVACLRALNPDGTLRWQFDAPERRRFGRIAIGPRDAVYVLNRHGQPAESAVYALDNRGHLKWSAALGPLDGAPLRFAADGTIYVACNPQEASYDDEQLRALDPRTGGKRWSVPGRFCGLDAGPDGTLYAVTQTGLTAIRPDGMILWQKKVHLTRPTLIGPGERLYCGSTVLSTSGRELYQLPRLGEGTARTYALDPAGRLYLFTGAGEIFALNE